MDDLHQTVVACSIPPVPLVALCTLVDLRVRDAQDRLDEIQRAAPLSPRLARL
jgi:hypothetical protein